jgi:DNA-directed RNA polymerase subunit M/transcription elongation factor TFIIS
MPKLTCKHCGHSLTTRRELAGKKVRCPACGETFRVKPPPIPTDLLQAKVDPRRRDETRSQSQRGARPKLAGLLGLLDSQNATRKILFSAWAIYVIIFACILVYFWCFSWLASYGRMPIFVLTQVFSLFTYAVFIAVLWIRRDTSTKKDYSSNQFVVVPIVADFLLANCEAIAVILLLLAIPATLIAPFNTFGLLDGYLMLSSIENVILKILLTALSNLLACVGTAVAIFVTGKLISEMLNILFSIGNDVHRIAEINCARRRSLED